MSEGDPTPGPHAGAARAGTGTAGAAPGRDGSAGAASGGGGRPPPSRPGLRRLWGGLIAIIAVAAGILLVNLLHNPDDGADQAAARPSASATAATTTPAGTATTAAPGTSPAGTPSAGPATTSAPTTRPPAPAGGDHALAPVVILNDSKIEGLAEAARKPVEDAGFTVDRVGGYVSTYDVPVTTVFYEEGLKPAAEALQRLVPGVTKTQQITANFKLVEPGKLILVVTRDFPTPAP
ncbi:LytR C-terminal domain-containing protein [Pseudofrankia sp. BMG5.36]|uniref:LytR C-terminal domain-containing protein n=1 Tax=Pseudofrankia sp. BMG5.36 TaxID=1834512 RepID=UPI0009F627EE|nr:LytR C-terminal domain-containing protein [Pseudofrankia sp. BMG5.36]